MGTPVDNQGSVTLNAAGNGTVRVGTFNPSQRWRITSASVRTSTNTLEPTANLYLGSRASFLGGTYTGSNDTTDLDVQLANSTILCEWTGGDPGATATLYIRGETA